MEQDPNISQARSYAICDRLYCDSAGSAYATVPA